MVDNRVAYASLHYCDWGCHPLLGAVISCTTYSYSLGIGVGVHKPYAITSPQGLCRSDSIICNIKCMTAMKNAKKVSKEETKVKKYQVTR